MDSVVKEEILDAEMPLDPVVRSEPPRPVAVIDLSSSDDSDSDSDSGDEHGASMAVEKKPRVLDGAADAGGPLKKRKAWDGAAGFALPIGFLDPLPREDAPPLPLPPPISVVPPLTPVLKSCKQFWKAGDYVGDALVESSSLSVGMDHVRVHPKFLHSNATSHKWALGALAELLDNALDEVCNRATFVNVDMLEHKKDKTRMLLVEDNGGGMDPDKMRQCMSLGYSAKSKVANTIGQYGNGFKTSTMRLGADVIVFSRCLGKGGNSSTQSVGMLSYTFLRSTAKEDIVVPMLDYEKGEGNWNKLQRSSSANWIKNLETIVQWSPYTSEADLLQQFSSMPDQGTRIVIYNLWEDDRGELELDFDADKYDIQVRGVNRDEKKIQMAKKFPNSRHFLTYRHSLRSYASILYLRLPMGFKMILRGKDIEHHNIVNDMMLKQEITYKPQSCGDGTSRDLNMVAVVTVGFVKDAKDHIDVQGFNVYHKNRLIKPFWRVWNPTGSEGRGVIGLLEANFVEPAHDKQDFERTTVLSRLEARLIQMQRNYWRTEAHKIGYAPRVKEKLSDCTQDKEILHEASPKSMTTPVSKLQDSNRAWSSPGKSSLSPVESTMVQNVRLINDHISCARENGSAQKSGMKLISSRSRVHKQSYESHENDSNSDCVPNGGILIGSSGHGPSPASNDRSTTRSCSKEAGVASNGNEQILQNFDTFCFEQLKVENRELKERLKEIEDANISLTDKLEEAEKKLKKANKEQEALIDIFSEERSRRDEEEENLRKKLKDAYIKKQELLEKLGSNRNSEGKC
uniref:MORC family CW-type zinc finger protein 4 n=1 Tax=Anthurium amnicola TaxID=1678845 RepID=A0A1D1Z602_9ARAE